MAGITRFMFLIGIVLFLGACSDEQVPPLISRTMYPSDPAIVRRVQLALRNRGYYAGVLDGFLGQNTAIGIQRFQIDHNQRVIPVVNRPLLRALAITSH
jgi:hypothetical protein